MDPTSEPNGPTGPTGPTESGQPGDLSPGPRASVAAKLGPAYAAADQVASFEEGQALPANVLQAFAALSPEEIAVLPEQMQLYVPTVSCDALRARPLAAIVQPDQEIVACDGDGRKYLLDVATVTGTDIRSAKSAEDQGLWTVTVALTADGQQRFTAVTRDLATDHGQLAIIVDETVVSAPTVQAEIPGDLQISGAFTANQAKLLAAQLAGGELPLVLNPIR
jgi:preprotein translocase subunit SecD